MTFTEANAVEEFVLDRMVELGWTYEHGPSLPRETADALLEPVLRDALIRLNPDIAAQPERADEVIYRLRGLTVGVTGAALVSANEEFTEWLRGERTMPFGPKGEHVTVNLVEWDAERLSANTFTVATQVTYAGGPEKRFDIVAYVNGLPLVVGEAKTPVRPAVSWVDGAIQVHDDYERNAPGMFVTNAFSFATEGKTYRYGAVRTPLEFWAPWRDGDQALTGLGEVEQAVWSMLRPDVVLDLARHFTV